MRELIFVCVYERLDFCGAQIQLGTEPELLESDAWVQVPVPPLTGVSWVSRFPL